MTLSDIYELSLIAVLNRGTPNEECIAIKVMDRTNLGQYGVMRGNYNDDLGTYPFKDNLFWFGDGIVNTGDWIFIYTGSGEPRNTKTEDNMNNVYSIFWGRDKTLFANSKLTPVLFRIDAVQILPPPDDLPQMVDDSSDHKLLK